MLVLKARQKGDIGRLAFAPDGASLCASVLGRKLELWDVATGRDCTPAGLTLVGDFCFHPSGRWLFGRGRWGRLAAHDLTTGTAHPAPAGSGEPGRVAVTPDGATVLCDRTLSSGSRYVSRAWSADGGFEPGWAVGLYTEPNRWERTRGLVALADGRRFATVDVGGVDGDRIAVRAVETGAVLARYPVDVRDTFALAVAPDDSLLVAAASVVLLVFAEADPAGEPRRVVKYGLKHLTGVAFHPSGRFLAATDNDATVVLYDTATWEVAKRYTWNAGKMRSVAFSPDGTLAAAGTDAGKVVVWDVDV